MLQQPQQQTTTSNNLEQFPPFDHRKHDSEDRDTDHSFGDEESEEENLSRRPRIKERQRPQPNQRSMETSLQRQTPATPAARISSSSSFDNESLSTINNAKSALLKKLSEYTKILETSYDFEQQKRMCELIGATAASLEKISNLSLSK